MRDAASLTSSSVRSIFGPVVLRTVSAARSVFRSWTRTGIRAPTMMARRIIAIICHVMEDTSLVTPSESRTPGSFERAADGCCALSWHGPGREDSTARSARRVAFALAQSLTDEAGGLEQPAPAVFGGGAGSHEGADRPARADALPFGRTIAHVDPLVDPPRRPTHGPGGIQDPLGQEPEHGRRPGRQRPAIDRLEVRVQEAGARQILEQLHRCRVAGVDLDDVRDPRAQDEIDAEQPAEAEVPRQGGGGVREDDEGVP